jgi:CBS domain-containing protein
VAKAATVLVERQIRLLPVVSEGKLVGTVSRADICHAIIDAL